MERFQQRSQLPFSAEEVFAWHARPGALERLTPPWESIQVLERSGGIENGARTVIRLRKGPFRFRWVAVHSDYVANRQFADEQREGPFAEWRHVHRMNPAPGGCVLEDAIEYRLPLSPLSDWLAGPYVKRDLERAFRFRHRRTRDDLDRHNAFRDQPRLHVAISGASGLIGSQLTAFLTSGGHRVSRLVRRPARSADEIYWEPTAGHLDGEALEGVEAVVHLSGYSLAAGRWTPARKRVIRESRLATTRLLSDALSRLQRPPRVMISASAIGYYGDRGAEPVDESSPPGGGFLADLCLDWEAACDAARRAGIRVVNLRTGVVISSAGGALGKLHLPFSLGLGGVVGSGRQYLSWISLDDLLGAIVHLIFSDQVDGPVNAVTAAAVANREFTRTLGRVLRRPTVIPLPAAIVRLLFGEMGEATLLGGANVRPGRLIDSGFRFLHPELETALRHELGRDLE